MVSRTWSASGCVESPIKPTHTHGSFAFVSALYTSSTGRQLKRSRGVFAPVLSPLLPLALLLELEARGFAVGASSLLDLDPDGDILNSGGARSRTDESVTQRCWVGMSREAQGVEVQAMGGTLIGWAVWMVASISNVALWGVG
jgi:hypothetical protein